MMNFDKFEIDNDKIMYWENDVMVAFDELFGEYEGNESRIKQLICICEEEIAKPKSWLTEFAARTALENLRADLDDNV
jgi:hypothetical protein